MGKNKGDKYSRKATYRTRLEELLDNYKSLLIVQCDHVGSNQMQKIRISLRGKGLMLMGKNTMIRNVIRSKMADNPKLEKLLPYVYGNIGFVFTNSDLNELRKTILNNRVPAAARVGVIAPDDCWIPAGPTGMDPGQTSFFQALNISTKIVKGAVEIVNDVHLIKKGSKVTPSHVSLLSKLDIKPFFYSMGVLYAYDDGAVYDALVLDMTQDDLLRRFFKGVSIIAALSLRIGTPNLATLPHSIARAFQYLLAVALTTDISFKEAEPYKEFLRDPSKFVASAPAAGGASSSAPAAKKEAEPVKEKEEEEEDNMEGFGDLFG
jgi:large subunit ribosomal protein LP0